MKYFQSLIDAWWLNNFKKSIMNPLILLYSRVKELYIILFSGVSIINPAIKPATIKTPAIKAAPVKTPAIKTAVKTQIKAVSTEKPQETLPVEIFTFNPKSKTWSSKKAKTFTG